MSQQQAMDLVPATLPKRQRRRRRLWLGVACMLFILWLVIVYAFFTYWMDRRLREAMAAADRDSPGGWQLEDIEAHREQIPDEENAAQVIVKVKRLLPANWPFETKSSDAKLMTEGDSARQGVSPLAWDLRLNKLPPEIQVDTAVLGSLRASLARVKSARTEARKLIGMTHGRFTLQWGDDILLTKVNSEDARIATNLLRNEAVLASEDGDADAAAACVRGMLGAARAVGDEPLLLSALTRIACDVQASEALERVLAQGEPSTLELEAVQALLEKELAEPLFLQAARGERAIVHKLLLSMRQGTTNLSELEWLSGSPRPKKTFLDYLGPTLARSSHARILELMNQYVKAAKLPPEEQPPVMDNLEQQVRKAKAEYDFVTHLTIPAMMRIANAYRGSVGSLRCASVALGLERYRRDHSHWPDSLDVLVPKYLAAVPKDPQDGKPLRFKRLTDGVLIYWIGHDGVDDDGKLNRRNPWAKGSDQGFQLWDATQRRQPARQLLPQPPEDEKDQPDA